MSAKIHLVRGQPQQNVNQSAIHLVNSLLDIAYLSDIDAIGQVKVLCWMYRYEVHCLVLLLGNVLVRRRLAKSCFLAEKNNSFSRQDQSHGATRMTPIRIAQEGVTRPVIEHGNWHGQHEELAPARRV